MQLRLLRLPSPPATEETCATAKAASRDKVPAAPQVVTIVHRLNGLKMFRLLLRSQSRCRRSPVSIRHFNLMDDVHTNVIAGLAMDDGETIAAWLPEADVEFGPPAAPFPPVAPIALKAKPHSPGVANAIGQSRLTIILTSPSSDQTENDWPQDTSDWMRLPDSRY